MLFFSVQSHPLPPHKSPQPSISPSLRKRLAQLREAVSCLQQQKEGFPQSGCSLDTVFCFFTITGTQGAAEKAFVLAKLLQMRTHALAQTGAAEEAHACLAFIQALLQTAHSGSLAYHCMINHNGAHKSKQLVHTHAEKCLLSALHSLQIYFTALRILWVFQLPRSSCSWLLAVGMSLSRLWMGFLPTNTAKLARRPSLNVAHLSQAAFNYQSLIGLRAADNDHLQQICCYF